MKTFLITHSHKFGHTNYLVQSSEEISIVLSEDGNYPTKKEQKILDALEINYEPENREEILIQEIDTKNMLIVDSILSDEPLPLKNRFEPISLDLKFSEEININRITIGDITLSKGGRELVLENKETIFDVDNLTRLSCKLTQAEKNTLNVGDIFASNLEAAVVVGGLSNLVLSAHLKLNVMGVEKVLNLTW